jgi:5-methylcytosine-specific restriction endonuclease McrA
MTRPRRRRTDQSGLGSRRWRNLVAQVVKEEPMCRLQIPGVCTRWSQTANHRLPRSRYPHLTFVRSNLEGACCACNMALGNRSLQRVRAEKAAALRHRRQPPAALEFFG